jgi:hypothetical protein
LANLEAIEEVYEYSGNKKARKKRAFLQVKGIT